MIRNLLLTVLIVAVTCRLTWASDPTPSAKPNFIVIFADDHGYGDLGCYGSPNIHSPNIDRMAAEGIRFTHFYAAPFCGPSRAQLMTGCYPPRVSHARNPGPGSKFGLHPSEVTIADLLTDNGYSTMCIGKWHLGDAPEFLPTRQGFGSFFGLPYSNDMWRYHPNMAPQPNEDNLMSETRKRAAYTGYAGQGRYYPEGGGFQNDLPLMRDERVIETNPDQRQLTTRYTEQALEFIDQNRQRPFFLYLAHAMPHVPLFVSEKFAGKSSRGLYGDVIMELDWCVGQILQRLKERGLDENTLVVFTTDNGPWLGYGIDGGSAGPLRDGKGTTWEGGVRVPAIFRWPTKIAPGQRTEAIAGNLDLLPTFADLSGASSPHDRIIDGRSLAPLLRGNTEHSPHEFFHYFNGSQPGKVNYRAIRDKRWKLTLQIAESERLNSLELFDLCADTAEKFDRRQQHPDEANRLLVAAQAFYDHMRANLRPAGLVSR